MQGEPQLGADAGGVEVALQQRGGPGDAGPQGVAVHPEPGRGRVPLPVVGQPLPQGGDQVAAPLGVVADERGQHGGGEGGGVLGAHQRREPAAREIGEAQHRPVAAFGGVERPARLAQCAAQLTDRCRRRHPGPHPAHPSGDLQYRGYRAGADERGHLPVELGVEGDPGGPFQGVEQDVRRRTGGPPAERDRDQVPAGQRAPGLGEHVLGAASRQRGQRPQHRGPHAALGPPGRGAARVGQGQHRYRRADELPVDRGETPVPPDDEHRGPDQAHRLQHDLPVPDGDGDAGRPGVVPHPVDLGAEQDRAPGRPGGSGPADPAVGPGDQRPGAEAVGEPVQHPGGAGVGVVLAQGGGGERPLRLVGADDLGVAVGGAGLGDGLGQRQERGALGDLQQRQPGPCAGLAQRGEQVVVSQTTAEPEPGEAVRDEPVHVAGRVGRRSEPGGQQQFVAVEIGRRIGQFARMHPRERSILIRGRTRETQSETAARTQCAQRQRHLAPCRIGVYRTSNWTVRTLPPRRVPDHAVRHGPQSSSEGAL